MRKYWSTVIRRAASDTTKKIGSNWKRTAIVALFTALAIGAIGYFEGGTAAFAKFEWWLLVLGGEVAVFLLLFFPMLLRTPYLLDKEIRDELEQFKAAAGSELESAKAELAETKLDRERLKNRDPKSNVIRGELTRYLEGFETIKKRLEGHQKKAMDDYHELDTKAFRYIQHNIPSYDRYDQRFPPQGTYTSSTVKVRFEPNEFIPFIDRCKDRIEQLQSLIEMHS